jgi:hypothetical protein
MVLPTSGLKQRDGNTNVMKGKFVSLKKSVVITEWCNVMVNSEDLTGITEYLTL